MSRYGVRAGLVTVGGELIDVPAPTRIFHRYTSETRANLSASHRTGHLQRNRVGEYFWTHPFCPNVAYPTRTRAIVAALGTLARSAGGDL